MAEPTKDESKPTDEHMRAAEEWLKKEWHGWQGSHPDARAFAVSICATAFASGLSNERRLTERVEKAESLLMSERMAFNAQSTELDAMLRSLRELLSVIKLFDHRHGTRYATCEEARRAESLARCDHEWVNAKNKAIPNGETCPKCDSFRTEPGDEPW